MNTWLLTIGEKNVRMFIRRDPVAITFVPIVMKPPVYNGYLFALIDCMVFNVVFNRISFVSRRPVRLFVLSWSSFSPVLHTIIFPSYWLLLGANSYRSKLMKVTWNYNFLVQFGDRIFS